MILCSDLWNGKENGKHYSILRLYRKCIGIMENKMQEEDPQTPECWLSSVMYPGF